MALHFAGQPGVVDISEVDDVSLASLPEGAGDLPRHELRDRLGSGQPGPPVGDHDQPG